MLTEENKVYFAAANTSKGFVSYFDSVFDPNCLKEIYIIKGGPGTGKSGLMRRIASAAEEKGHQVERFICSSDPGSLDGVIIKDKGIAFLDGTNPHTTDPKYPGVVETILNTGNFWDKKKLLEHKSEIISLIQEKNRYYKRAYQFLKAAGEIAREIEAIGKVSFEKEKMSRCIERIEKKIFKESTAFSDEVRQITAMGSQGKITLNSFEKESKAVYVLVDHCFAAYAFLEELYQKAKCASQEVARSHSCLLPDRIDALYFPKLRCAFLIRERDYNIELPEKTYHYVNMKRFISKENCKNNRQKLRFGGKCMDMLLNGAEDAFLQAASSHNQLEKIYISAMDFASFEEMSEKLLKDLI